MNRLAMVLVQEEENKILAITNTSNSTSKVEAEKVKEIFDNWSVTDQIVACGFDTTAANTGLYKGACTILQQLTKRQFLWMACRHHILELIVRRCFRVNCHKMKTARSTTVFMYFVMSATSCCTSLSISNYQFSCNTLKMRDFFRVIH